MKGLKEFLARLTSERKRLGLKSSGIMESMDSSDTPMTDLEKFLEGLKAVEESLGLKSSGIMESMEKMDSSDTPTYTVVFVPRRPQPKGEAPKV